MDQPFSFELLAQNDYAPGQPIRVSFRLHNNGPRDAWVLTWYTPLEGIKGKIFDVTCSGRPVAYEGRLMKRGNPTADDYTYLAAGETASAEVDLAQAYQLRSCDPCVVRFSGALNDVVWEERQLPRIQDQHQQVSVTGNTISFHVGG